MATVIEDVISRFRWVTNREELRAAKRSTDELAQATEKLDAEVAQSARTQAELRRELIAIKKARAAGEGDAKEMRAREAQIRIALSEQAEAAREAKTALAALRKEQAAAAKEAGALARAEEAAAKRVAAAATARLAAARGKAVAAYKGQAAADAAKAEESNWSGGFRKAARQRFRDATSPEAGLDALGGAASGVSGAARAGIGVAVGGALAGGVALGAGAASVGMEFEKLRTALATTEGSAAKAEEAFKRIRDFAKSTPFDVQGVTDAFIKLKNRGLDASEPALRAYGDTASAMGKSLDDMIEAVADAATGEFERLKALGVKASVQGDRVRLTFRGVTTEVAKDAGEIERYLIKLGQTNFGGGMEAQSKTLAGVLGGLADSFKLFLDEIFRGEFGTALKEVAADLGLFADGAASAAAPLSGALAAAVREVWAAIKDLLGNPADLGERIAGWAKAAGEFIVKAGELASFLMSLFESIGGGNVALIAFGAAILGLVGPFGAALAAGVALGAWLGSTFPGVAQSFIQAVQNVDKSTRDLIDTGDALSGFKDNMLELARSTDESAAAFGRMMLKISGATNALEDLDKVERGRREDAAKAAEAARRGKAVADAREAEASRRDAAAKAASAGMAARGLGAQQAKLKRYKELGRKKHLSPSEQKELQAIRKELDLPTPSHEKHKPDSAYEADREAEIKKLRQQAERRAGFRAQLAGKSAKEQLAAAHAAGERTERNLRDSTKAGGALPGELNVGVLRAAGFNDVAGAGQPPPVAVTIVKVPEFAVNVTFSGPVNADMRMLREEIDKVIARTLPEQLADGLRNVKWPTLY